MATSLIRESFSLSADLPMQTRLRMAGSPCRMHPGLASSARAISTKYTATCEPARNLLAPVGNAARRRTMNPKRLHHRLYLWVLAAMVLGIAFGFYFPGPALAMQPLATGFIKL